MDMSLIAGMPEVIAYIRAQDERIKALKDENEHLEARDKMMSRIIRDLQAENEALKKQKIPDHIISAFTGLTDNWWGDEEKFYAENFEPEQEPEDIPTDKLEPCNYRDLRILDEWFQKIKHSRLR
jgi:hypothetical protein